MAEARNQPLATNTTLEEIGMTLRRGMLAGTTVLAASISAMAVPASATSFRVTALVADRQGAAANADKQLRGPWGLAPFAGALSVADEQEDVATMYDPATGAKASIVVRMPNGKPTGQAAIPAGNGFVVTEGSVSGESAVVFATESGVLAGWNPNVDANKAIVAFGGHGRADGGGHGGHGGDFTGLAYDPATNHLFVADLRGNSVVVLDNTFAQVSSFTDPNLPAGYAPYNVALLNGNLYVAYALRKGDDARTGAGLGYVDVFQTDGSLVTTLVANGTLNAPWGMAIAPASFGDLAGTLLVANNGDGRINAFDTTTGTLVGTVSDSTGASVQIDGLRALLDSGTGSMLFSADPHHRNKGLLGAISAQ
jgi:uncharacterized protein (TIGR03118 family)